MSAPKVVPKTPEAGAAEAPKKSKKVLIIAVALILSVAGAGGAWFFLKKGEAKHEEVKVQPAKPPVFLPLDTFVVNLQSEGGEFLQVNMTLQMKEQVDVEVLKTYMPLIRSRIISLLSAKQPADILTADGKTKLAAELSESIKQPFDKGVDPAKVDAVFFTSFVVQ